MRGPCLCGDPYCPRCFGGHVVYCDACGLELVGPCGEAELDDVVAERVVYCDGGFFDALVRGLETVAWYDGCGPCYAAFEADEAPRRPHVVRLELDDPRVWRCPDCGALTPAQEEVA